MNKIMALAIINELQETVGKHARALSILADNMAEIDKRLAAIAKAARC
jgi:hypothetical protein